MDSCQELIGSWIKLTISSNKGIPYYNSIKAVWDGKRKSKFGPECKLPLPPPEALDYLLQILNHAHQQSPDEFQPSTMSPLVLHCFTDHKTLNSDGQTQIYHAHPAYHGRMPWNDWVYVEYSIHTHGGWHLRNVFERHLSKIILFVVFSKISHT